MSESLKGHYYFRVPRELRGALVRNIRRLRWRGAILFFPVLLLIGTALVILAVVTRGHAIVYWVREIAGPEISDRDAWLALTGVAAVVAAIGLVVTLWLMYRESPNEEHLFCKDCPAVDSDDEGTCPVCQRPLSEHGYFIYTQYADEQKMLARQGLEGWRGA